MCSNRSFTMPLNSLKALPSPRVIAKLTGLALTFLAVNTYAFGWKQETRLTESGVSSIAQYTVSENVQYEISGLCEEGAGTPTIQLKIRANQNDPQFAKYFPPQAIPPAGQSQSISHPAEVTFDWTAAGNPWQISGTVDGDTHTMTLSFDSQSYYTQKIRLLLASSQYLNLKVKQPHSPKAFVTAIPLLGLKSHLAEATECENQVALSVYNYRPSPYNGADSGTPN